MVGVTAWTTFICFVVGCMFLSWFVHLVRVTKTEEGFNPFFIVMVIFQCAILLAISTAAVMSNV